MKRTSLNIFLFSLLLLSACTTRLHEVKDTRDIMGTVVSITIYDPDKGLAEDAIDSAFEEIMRIDRLLSNYKNDSEVSRLNRDKEISDYSEDLKVNIEKSIYYGNLSEGGFDITVQPILDLYTESFSVNERPPTDEEIEQELEKVDFTRIFIEENRISIGEEQKITLGGIAKGYAVDKAVEVLKEKGIEHALVNAGGDMRAIGRKYASVDWQIALANPRDKNDYIEVIPLADKAVVTSGDYERYFNENKSFHHIVNPKTGYSATELISVTIIAPDAFDADAISTSVFVMGEEKGLALVESLEGVEGLLIDSERNIERSSGFE